MERLLLLDGNGLIYRGYFALIDQPLTTSKGELVTAVFGFTNIVLRAIQDVKPDRIAVAFDLGKPTFRHERYAEYKANRTRMPDDMREQIPKVREVVRALGIPVYEREGFEADDAIATLVGQAEAHDFEVTILTGDLDMLQLVSERTRLMVSLRGGIANTVAYDLAKIDDRWGLRPDQMLDYKALKGDPTDNIPGIPGVGEKTASKLIATWESLDNLYRHLDEVTPEKLRPLLAEHSESVLESRELMRLVRDVDVTLDPEAGRVGEYDREAVVRLFREYEFRTLIDRLPPLSGERPEDAILALREVRDAGFPAAQGVGRSAGTGPGGPRSGARDGNGAGATAGGALQLSMDFDMVSGGAGAATGRLGGLAGTRAAEERAEAIAQASGDLPGALAAAIVDPGRIEVVGPDGVAGLETWLRGQPAVGVALVVDDPRPLAGTPLALAVAGDDGRVVAAEGPDAALALRHLLETVGAHLVGHEVKPFLTARFAEAPAETPLVVDFDTQIAAYLVNAALRAQKIADVVAERLDLVLPPAAAGLPPTAIAGLEALSVLAVRPSLAQALRDEGVERLFAEVELPLIPILARMEAVGIALDEAALGELEREFATEIERLEREIYDAVGHEFTIGSPKQLGEILFVELQLPKGRKTKTGYSTDATVLEELRGVHPVIEPVLDWRIYTKLRSTYVEALPHLIGPDGRLHTLFHQAVAATGRLSSSDPNLQNIPIRTPLGRRIRHAFVAGSPDTTLVAADYSQIELRILAHVSGDEHLADAFARGADIHRETAARVLRKEPAEVTSRRAVDGQDGQLRAGVRDERLRPVVAGRDQPPGRPGVHQLLLRRVRRDQPLHAPHPRDRARGGLRGDAARPAPADPGARGPQRRAARGGRADGDQHAHPGHGRGHRQDRDDPARPGAPRRRIPFPAAAVGPRRAAARDAPRRGGPAAARAARDDGRGAAAVGPAHGRGQGRRLVGGDDAGVAPGRGALGGRCRPGPQHRSLSSPGGSANAQGTAASAPAR